MEEPGQRPFAGVDLRRPKGYPAASTAPAEAEAEAEAQGDPCPRCESRDTKFCYYNNYNTSQPRHYCRSCRRYWTKGGSLRNVPVGGGSRKSASSSSSSSAEASASPRRAKNSKRRRVAPPEPEPGTTDAAGAAEKEAVAGTVGYPTTEVDAARAAAANGTVGDVDAARTEATANNGTAADVDAARTEATANGTVDASRTEATAGAPLTVDDVGFCDPSMALGLGVADAGGKDEPCDASPFEWPSGCDLGSYWAPSGVFADTDPVLFLNLP